MHSQVCGRGLGTRPLPGVWVWPGNKAGHDTSTYIKCAWLTALNISLQTIVAQLKFIYTLLQLAAQVVQV